MPRARRGEVLDPPALPPPPPVVPRRHLTQAERFDRREKVGRAYEKAVSKVVTDVTKALTAAADFASSDKGSSNAPNAATRTWQHAIFGYSSSVPELGAAKLYVGNALARCSLQVGKRGPDGSVEQGYDGEEPVEGLDSTIAEEAAEIIASIRSPRGGQSELLRNHGEKTFLVGEYYLVPLDTPAGMVFEVLSTQELVKEGTGWARYDGPGYQAEKLPEGTEPIRVWRPDAQFGKQATSSVRSCMEILEELVVLTRLVRASAISRMALAGVFVIPDEIDSPTDEGYGPDGDQSEAKNPLLVDIINTGAKAIDDPASAAAFMPYMFQCPAELIQHIKHIPFQATTQEHVIQRDEALQRLAQGLDLPVEVVRGHQACVDADTEILTDSGWRRYDDVPDGAKALTLNHATGLAEWQTIEATSRYMAHDQEMMRLEGRKHSSLTTLNHRWPIITQRGKRKWRESKDLNTGCKIIPAVPLSDLPIEAKHSDAFVELVAWYYTEGTDHKTGSATIYQSETANPGHVSNIRRMLTDLFGPSVAQMHTASRATGRAVCRFPECGWPVHSHGLCSAHRYQERIGIELRPVHRHSVHPGFDVRTRPAWRESQHKDMVRFNINKAVADGLRCYAPDKVPSHDFLLSLTASQLELFIRRSVEADGWCKSNGSNIQFHQVDPRRTDAFEFALILSGRTVRQRESYLGGPGQFSSKHSMRYEVLGSGSAPQRVGFGIKQKVVRYNGIVWCPTLPNGTWMARRNGQIHFTGNTTFANAAQINADIFTIHLAPTLQLLCDALTETVLWPRMAMNRGIDADHLADTPYPPEILTVAVTYDARELISRPDRVKEMIEVWNRDLSFSALSKAEIREALGLDGDGGPDDEEWAARVNAYRLGRVRENIPAPASDAAVPVADASAGNATSPTQPRGVTDPTGGVQASAWADQSESTIQALVDYAIERSVERVGAKVREKMRGRAFTEFQRALIEGVPNHAVTSILGDELVAQALGNETPSSVVAADINALERTVTQMAVGTADPVAAAKAISQLAMTKALDRMFTPIPVGSAP